MKDFVHLHVHSEYSLLDGLTKFDSLMERVKELGMSSVALTDHGGMFGAIKFYNKARAAGIKPIIGVETYIAKRTRFDKDPKLDNDQYHLILLAKSEKGYKNLLKIVSASYLEGYYYKPRVDFDLLNQYHDDVIALSGCLSGIGSYYYKQDQDELAQEGLLKLYGVFGKDFYIEMQRHYKIAEQEKVNKKLIEFSKRHGLPLVATADSHYTRRDDAEAQEILLCIQTQKTINDPNRGLSMIEEPDFYIKSREEMNELFLDLPEALDNTVKIAEQVNIKLDIGKLIFPKFPLPKGETTQGYLRKLAYEGLPKRYETITPELEERLNYELTIIEDKQYPTYFLIVQDFTNWAKAQGIGVGPGRGSAAGSLLSYVLGITDLDPLFHKLPFERFLNPERASPPDIDMDFADDRREEVIQYVTQRYGEDHVAQIVTFGTMESRAAVRDCGRALGYAYADCDRIAKMIPQGAQGFHMTIDHALKLSPELRQAYDTEAETKRLLDLAKKMSGVARHASVHAAGVVIGDKPLVEYTPLMRETKGEKIVTQYDMYSLDLNAVDGAVGLMKMDFLGLRTLTILQKACAIVKDEQGVDLDLLKLPLDDPKAYAMITSGNTIGIFQIESSGMRRLARDLKTSTFTDIQAMVALFRPGPMDLIPSFIDGKMHPERVSYPHPALKEVLDETYGVIVFQEQCLEIAVKFAGYSMGTADLLRRAIGKKKKNLMEIEKKKFIEGAQKMGHTKAEGEAVFGFIEKFASYGFNKAHTACYAMITYQTAYMKAHYPIEFMAAVLTAETMSKSGTGTEEKVSGIIGECKHLNIDVLPPNINKSFSTFTIEHLDSSPVFPGLTGDLEGGVLSVHKIPDPVGNDSKASVSDEETTNDQRLTTNANRAIRFGMAAVKNVGEGVAEAIVKERKHIGEFRSFFDFIKRMDGEKANKRTIESLIKAGAFDMFGKRKTLLFAMDMALEQVAKQRKVANKNQSALFGEDELKSHTGETFVMPEDTQEFSQLELLRMEKEMLGFYYSSVALFSEFKQAAMMASHKVVELLKEETIGKNVLVIGLVTAVRKLVTKAKQEEMAFVKIEDETGEVECVVFPRTYGQIKEQLVPNQPLVLCGKVDSRNDEISFIVEYAAHPQFAQVVQERHKQTISSNKSYSKGNDIREYTANKSNKAYGEAKPAHKSSALELFIKRGTTRDQLEQVNEILKRYQGSRSLTIVLENKTSLKRIQYPTPVDISSQLRTELEQILGGNCLQNGSVN